MKSRFTEEQSQVATAIEVIVCLIAAVAFWLIGYRTPAILFLIGAVVSMSLHFHRDFKD